MTKAETLLGGYEAGAIAAGLAFHCARCGKQLTDPASIQHGWGPECRHLANEVLAKTIPANTVRALEELSASVLAGSEGVVAEILEALRVEILEGAGAGRADWRGVVHCLVRLITITPEYWKATLCNIIAALGYEILAHVARGSASPSPAELVVENGRLVLKSKRNKPALAKLRVIQGRQFHGISKTWSFPVASLREVVAVVETYWPTSKLDVMSLLKTCAAVKIAGPPSFLVVTTEVEGKLELATPYNAAFVADLKAALPWNKRGWDPVKKVWWVDLSEQLVAKDIVAKHFSVPSKAVAA